MKILVISDTHLTPKFEERKFRAISSIIGDHDKVIINGDFWDGYICKFNDFYKSSWKALFPILKNKETAYIFGNHDEKKFNDILKLNSFAAVSGHNLTLNYESYKYYFEHGHRFIPLGDEKANINSKTFKAGLYFFNNIEKMLIKSSGDLYQKFTIKYNTIIKNRSANLRKNFDFLFCGHTHAQEIDTKSSFVNSGVFKFGLGQYVTIYKNEIKPFTVRY